MFYLFIFAGCWLAVAQAHKGADLPAWLGAADCAFVLLPHCGGQVLLPIAPASRKMAGSRAWALTTRSCSLGSNYLGFPVLSAGSVCYRYNATILTRLPGPQLPASSS